MSRRRQAGEALLAGIDAQHVLTPDGFERAQVVTLEAEGRVSPARTWWPSLIGHPCDRYAVWKWTRWDQQAGPSPTLQSIFDQGEDLQPLVYERLEQMGFDVVREYDRPQQYTPRPGVVISGRPDGKLMGWRGERYRPPYVLEAKAVSEWVWDSINTLADVQHHTSFRVRGYYSQGNLYAFNDNLPHGALAFYSKATGLLKLIAFALDYAHVEGLLRRTERLQPLIDAREDPPPLPYSPDTCRRCEFARQCYPAKSFGEGLAVIENDPMLAKLERWWALRPGGQEYARLHDEVREYLLREGVRFSMLGRFVIEGRQTRDGKTLFDIDRL